MKVNLEKIPELRDLEEGYNQILHAQRAANGKIDLVRFATYCQWSRFDSRMGEICVGFLSQFWEQINPVALHDVFAQQAWPNLLGVLLEFHPNESKLFQMWKRTATCEFQKADGEQFFIGKRRIASPMMFDDARFSLEEYRKWGYLGREILINKQGRKEGAIGVASYSRETRVQILRDLISHHPRITTQQYWEAIGKSVSKRQAERDLQTSNFLQGKGNTKGRFFLKRK